MESFIFCAVLAFATVLAFAFANHQLNTLDPVVEPPTSTTSFFLEKVHEENFIANPCILIFDQKREMKPNKTQASQD